MLIICNACPADAPRYRRRVSPTASPLRADDDCYLCPQTNLSAISPTVQWLSPNQQALAA